MVIGGDVLGMEDFVLIEVVEDEVLVECLVGVKVVQCGLSHVLVRVYYVGYEDVVCCIDFDCLFWYGQFWFDGGDGVIDDQHVVVVDHVCVVYRQYCGVVEHYGVVVVDSLDLVWVHIDHFVVMGGGLLGKWIRCG